MDLTKLLDEEYLTKFKNVKKKVEDLYDENRQHEAGLPFYTPHDYEHCQRVENIIYQLFSEDTDKEASKESNEIPKTSFKNLEVRERFYLLASAYLHDLGMIKSVAEEVEDDPGSLDAQIIRENHHRNSERYIIKNWKALGLEEFESGFVGKLCRFHRKAEDINACEEVLIVKDVECRLSLLAAYLRLADALDIAITRAPSEPYAVCLAYDIPEDQKFHWIKSRLVNGVLLKPKEHKIYVQFQYPSSKEIENPAEWELTRKKIESIIDLVIDDVRDELASIMPVLAKAGFAYYLEVESQKASVVLPRSMMNDLREMVNNYDIMMNPSASKLVEIILTTYANKLGYSLDKKKKPEKFSPNSKENIHELKKKTDKFHEDVGLAFHKSRPCHLGITELISDCKKINKELEIPYSIDNVVEKIKDECLKNVQSTFSYLKPYYKCYEELEKKCQNIKKESFIEETSIKEALKIKDKFLEIIQLAIPEKLYEKYFNMLKEGCEKIKQEFLHIERKSKIAEDIQNQFLKIVKPAFVITTFANTPSFDKITEEFNKYLRKSPYNESDKEYVRTIKDRFLQSAQAAFSEMSPHKIYFDELHAKVENIIGELSSKINNRELPEAIKNRVSEFFRSSFIIDPITYDVSVREIKKIFNEYIEKLNDPKLDKDTVDKIRDKCLDSIESAFPGPKTLEICLDELKKKFNINKELLYIDPVRRVVNEIDKRYKAHKKARKDIRKESKKFFKNNYKKPDITESKESDKAENKEPDKVENKESDKAVEINILLYGYSELVTEAICGFRESLMSAENPELKHDSYSKIEKEYSDKIRIIICECQPKTQTAVGDRLTYYDGLEYALYLKKRGFTQIVIIPDIIAGTLMEQLQVDFILMGSNGVTKEFFMHSAGHAAIVNLARYYNQTTKKEHRIKILLITSKEKVRLSDDKKPDDVEPGSNKKDPPKVKGVSFKELSNDSKNRDDIWQCKDKSSLNRLKENEISLCNPKEDKIPIENVDFIISDVGFREISENNKGTVIDELFSLNKESK